MQEQSTHRSEEQSASRPEAAKSRPSPAPSPFAALQGLAGNSAIARAMDGGPSSADVRAGGPVQAEVTDAIAATRGAGSRLDPGVAGRAGGALGADLSDVHVHTDNTADLLSRSIGARAFTSGRDVYFRRGQFSTGTDSGRHLLGHELAHVAQQGPPGAVHPKSEVAAAGSAAERAADRAAETVATSLAGGRAEAPGVAPGGPGPAVTTMAPAAGATGALQRDVGFEFQTGWGLVRSLPAAPNPLGAGVQDRDPNRQSDYPDVAVNHGMAGPTAAKQAPTRALPPKRSFWDVLAGRNKAPKLGESPTTPEKRNQFPNFDYKGPAGQAFTDTAYMHKGTIIAHPTAGRNHFKFHKGQIIKDYGDFKMTVDDATTPLGAELEWVIDPPVKDSASPKDMGKVMDHLITTAKKLLKVKMRESFLLSEVTKEAGDDTVELQPAVKGYDQRDMEAAAQVTGGVKLDQLIRLFQDIGGRSADPSKAAKAATPDLQGSSFAQKMTDVAGRVAGSNELKGLVAYVARYLDMGAAATPLSYAKVNTQFLARTDFATMFSHLPEADRRKYGGLHYADVGGAAGHVDDFVNLVLGAFGGGLREDRKIFVGGIKDGTNVKNLDLTVGEWLRGLPEGKDLLSSKYWSQVAKDPNASQAQKNRAGVYKPELESMGNLQKTDAVGEGGADPGIIMEFRSNTTPRAISTWKNYAVNAFTYLRELNRRSD